MARGCLLVFAVAVVLAAFDSFSPGLLYFAVAANFGLLAAPLLAFAAALGDDCPARFSD
jgi:hypothetical protein